MRRRGPRSPRSSPRSIRRRRPRSPSARSARSKTRSRSSSAIIRPMSDPLAELENVFASLKNPQPKELPQPVTKSGIQPRTPAAPPPPRPSNGAERQMSGACRPRSASAQPEPQQRDADAAAGGRARRFRAAAPGCRQDAKLWAAAGRRAGAGRAGRRRLRRLAEPGCVRRRFSAWMRPQATVAPEPEAVPPPEPETPAARSIGCGNAAKRENSHSG